jgi:hypothetical protein
MQKTKINLKIELIFNENNVTLQMYSLNLILS